MSKKAARVNKHEDLTNIGPPSRMFPSLTSGMWTREEGIVLWQALMDQKATPSMGKTDVGPMFLVPPSTTMSPTSRKINAANDYMESWITVKGYSTYPDATHNLGPVGWTVRISSFPFFVLKPK